MKGRLVLAVLLAGCGIASLLISLNHPIQASFGNDLRSHAAGTIHVSVENEGAATAAVVGRGPQQADTTVNGNISSDTTWTTANSPYVVQYNIKILNGATLTLEPGVEVRLGHEWNGLDYIEVQSGGSLIVEGMPSQPITFTSEFVTPGKGDWGYIRVMPGASARFSHCDIGYGGDRLQAPLQVRSLDVQVRDCRIHDNVGRGVQFEATGSGPVVENTHFENNNSYAVAQHSNSAPTYVNLSGSGNGEDAIVIVAGLDYVTGGVHWQFNRAGLPVHVEGDLKINPGGYLSLGAGTQLRMSDERGLIVEGALYALGTSSDPITVTGPLKQPGSWIGVDVRASGAAILRHVDLGYGGAWLTGGGSGYGGFLLKIDSNSVVLQNSRVYSSSLDGIAVYGGRPIINNNRIEGNFESGLRNYTPWTKDARSNWWGSHTGPWHQTVNPGGTGDRVRGPVKLDPWLDSPPLQSADGDNLLILQTGGPNRAYPGQIQDYAVSYGNFLTQTIGSAVVTMLLPDNAQYVDSTAGGIYWPEMHEVFWKLGDLTPESIGAMSVRVQYDWGVPDGFEDGVMALLGGTNLTQSKLNVAPYLAYIPVEILEETGLTSGELNGELSAYPDMNQIYGEAIAAGFEFADASRLTLSVGEPVTQVVLINVEREVVTFLRRQGPEVLASIFDGMNESYGVRDASGGMTLTTTLWNIEYWGSWSTAGGTADARLLGTETTLRRCFFNCLVKKVPVKMITKRIKLIKYALKSADCVKWFRSDPEDEKAGAKCLLFIKNVPGVGEVIDVADCYTDCKKNPNQYDCTEDTVTCVYSFWNIPCWFATCQTYIRCQDGYYSEDPFTTPCANYEFGKKVKCIEGVGCIACGDTCPEPPEDTLAPSAPAEACGTICGAGSTCSSWATRISVPHDPNAKDGIDGDLLPGQIVTYTISYENEGTGQAYGVYILDQLDEAFDLGSITVGGGGQLLGQSGMVIWQIGELAPKGQPGSSGVVSFTARLKDGLPSGTVVSNQATVVFPSVGEETPTNLVVNVVQPVVALPQVVETTYGQPVTITLQGLEVSGLPLTYTVVSNPWKGELSGDGANLTYTPTAHFVGEDGFTFTASNGITESRASAVRLIVHPSAADVTPPTVAWSLPAPGEEKVGFSSTPIYTDVQGGAYAPVVIVQFSEPMSATTVTNATVTLSPAGGGPLSTTVWYDSLFNQAFIVPREALAPDMEYAGAVTQGVTDVSGNQLAIHTWQFRTVGESSTLSWTFLPLLMRSSAAGR